MSNSNIVKKLKESIQRSGGSKSKFIKVAPDKKIRIRFLEEMESGREFTFHNNYEAGIDAICRTHYGEDCPLCEAEVYAEKRWAWSVWDVDSKEVKVFLWKATSKSPVAQFLSCYETYETILDRDYVLARKGSMLETTYQVMPMDKSKFRNEKAKPYSESGLLKLLNSAFAIKDFDLDDDEDDEIEEETPTKKSKKKSKESAPELDMDWLEEKLDSEDIDEDEFCEYHEVKSLDKLKKKSKKDIKRLIEDFIANEESDEDEDYDDDEDDDDDDE